MISFVRIFALEDEYGYSITDYDAAPHMQGYSIRGSGTPYLRDVDLRKYEVEDLGDDAVHVSCWCLTADLRQVKDDLRTTAKEHASLLANRYAKIAHVLD